MTDRRVLALSALAFLTLLASLLILALPDTYEGEIVYDIDAGHTIRTFDLVGLALMTLGGTAAWGAGILWQRCTLAST